MTKQGCMCWFETNSPDSESGKASALRAANHVVAASIALDGSTAAACLGVLGQPLVGLVLRNGKKRTLGFGTPRFFECALALAKRSAPSKVTKQRDFQREVCSDWSVWKEPVPGPWTHQQRNTSLCHFQVRHFVCPASASGPARPLCAQREDTPRRTLPLRVREFPPTNLKPNGVAAICKMPRSAGAKEES